MINHADIKQITIKFVLLGQNKTLKRRTHSIQKANNLEEIMKKIKDSCKAQQLELYDDKEEKPLVFHSDEEIIEYFYHGRKVYYKVLKECGDQSFISVQSSSAKKQPQPQQAQSILSSFQKPEKMVSNEVSNNMRRLIESLLKENLKRITSQLTLSNNKTFNIPCSLCRKPAEDTIFACQMNLLIVSCKTCSPYLKYQIPFPFKPFTNPSLYQTQRSQQPPNAQQHFRALMQEQRLRRNKAIEEKLSKLPVFTD